MEENIHLSFDNLRCEHGWQLLKKNLEPSLSQGHLQLYPKTVRLTVTESIQDRHQSFAAINYRWWTVVYRRMCLGNFHSPSVTDWENETLSFVTLNLWLSRQDDVQEFHELVMQKVRLDIEIFCCWRPRDSLGLLECSLYDATKKNCDILGLVSTGQLIRTRKCISKRYAGALDQVKWHTTLVAQVKWPC